MPKALVPQISHGGARQQCLWRSPERIQLAITVTSEHLRPGGKILDRKTTGIKFDGHTIVSGE
jgi:hypothetical protein